MPLQSTSIVPKTYTGENLELEGQAMVQVKYDQEVKLLLLVVEGTGPSLFVAIGYKSFTYTEMR